MFLDSHLWELDLSSKFDVSTPKWTTHLKPENWDQHYNGASGTLWDIGDGKFYTLGGWMPLLEGPVEKQVGEPYITPTSSGYHYQLPELRVFAYDPTTGNWSSYSQKDIRRQSDTAYAVRDMIGYTFGGLQVVESSDSPSVNFDPQKEFGAWISTISKYDFRSHKFFDSTPVPDWIGAVSRVEMHSLDNVGEEGVLIAFAGKIQKNDPNLDEQYVCNLSYSS